ncbi:hypothetical protein HHI36_002651 [Cryptolaemus montrouzieri]|uniref:Lipase domain-containing protein n=1 Tax=Cryptolaemus montrouzieri TaxID=559131 RepID=A0ABD2PC16_9CUCU
MKAISFFILIFLTAGAYAGMFNLPNPIKIAENIATKVDEGTKAGTVGIVEGLKKGAEVTHVADAGKAISNGVSKGADVAQKVNEKATKGTKTALGKVHNGVFDVENGVVTGIDEVIGTPVNANEVTFYLVTADNVDNPTKIDYLKPDELAQTKGKIFFIIHGWMASRNTSWFHDLSAILIKANPENRVLQVNWDKPASDNYALAAFKTESVGNLVGILINRLVTEYKIPSDNIVLIGHSLGGQISGWAAKKFKEITGNTLPRIIALDPAGPLFLLRPDSRRLNKHDAKVVMVIHSDGGKLGFPTSCGTIDFYPNGGSNQPGCWSVDLARISSYVEPVTCDHSRAWDFFLEAVNSTGSFLSRKCKSFGDFQKNICEAVEVAMGDLETLAQGSFYLETNHERPYSKFLKRIVDHVKADVEKVEEHIDRIRHKSSAQDEDIHKSSTESDVKSEA